MGGDRATRGASTVVACAVRPAAFLDRDGVISALVFDRRTGRHESPYRPEDVSLTPGAVDALRLLQGLDLPLVVISNQPSAAKGTSTLDALYAVHGAVERLLVTAGIRIDRYEYCFHHPQGSVPELTRLCACRKPEPGMIFAAAERLGCDPALSWVVGDSDVDVEAGRRAGCRTILVDRFAEHLADAPREAHPDYLVGTLAEAADIILGSTAEAPSAERTRLVGGAA